MSVVYHIHSTGKLSTAGDYIFFEKESPCGMDNTPNDSMRAYLSECQFYRCCFGSEFSRRGFLSLKLKIIRAVMTATMAQGGKGLHSTNILAVIILLLSIIVFIPDSHRHSGVSFWNNLRQKWRKVAEISAFIKEHDHYWTA